MTDLPPDRPLIVFTDLDGTLLDHETYAFAAAEPALALLRERAVPLILASSKTAAEIAPIRSELGFGDCPAIVENGAGVLAPEGGEAEAAADDYQRLRAIVATAPADLRRHFSGFSDMGVQGITAATGLPADAARLAATRRFSEPGLWSGGADERARFVAWLERHGVHARSGGRFLTLSFGGTKAGRMEAIASRIFPDARPFIVALGDAPNDVEMLEAADRAFIVANPHGTGVPRLSGEDDGTVTRTADPGPSGWNGALLGLLSG
ncbi:HAD-IIB family hydrolase [Roseitalea porphyridii]|uniref:Mannosyl-3-phosphoglycerate phosphatase n=1 Tax=Roseitalea porphyridii TaxID=1852022 RepID=A0A4P6V2A7_9HYPH|nr:HAD hydrolase family protein [Roseitalea porphyridii]QBK31522.1 mannosyl-3-phosphoglycerate phosphatase [Roseitalea porphyridii]